MCESELRMKILLIFTLCLISDGEDSREVTVCSGGGVLMKCKYHTGYTQNKKYLYNISAAAFCYQMNAAANINLIKLCEDNIKSVKNISMLMDVTDRGDLNTSCHPEPFMSEPTVLCERLQTANVQNCEHVNKEKFSLSYDTKTLNVTVNIRNVTEQDAGEYWCEASRQSGNGNTVYFTQIILTVTDSCVSVSTMKTTQPSPSSTSPPTGFSASIVIPVTVILLLLLVAFIIFLIMILQKKRRMKAGVAPSGKCCVQCSANNQEDEEIKDTRQLCESDADIFTISPAQLPTIPSDASQNIYDNALLPTSHFVSTIYSTAEFPIILPDQDISATTQLPTDLPASSVSAAQQSGGESVTGPVYAAVSSHIKATSSNSTVPKIIIDKEEISCDNEIQP